MRLPSRTPGRIAFSLVEVCLAFAILGLAMVPVLGLFSGAAKQAKTTSDHSFALALAQKVAEELRVAEWENPHAVEGVSEGPATPEPVTGSVAHAFEVIEDLAPPYGRIQPGVDPGIGPEFSVLHKQASTFSISVGGVRRDLPTTGSVLDVEVSLHWTDLRGNPRQIQTPVVMGATRNADTFAPPARELADERVARVLYPDETGTLPAIVGTRGGELDAVRDLGDAVVNVMAITSTADDHRARMAALRLAFESAGNDAAKARASIALGRAAEERAGHCFEAIRCVSPVVKKLADAFELARLGTPPPETGTWFTAIRLMGSLGSAFGGAVLTARDAYLRAYNGPLGDTLPPRVRARLGMKLIDLSKLKILTHGPRDLAPLVAFLESFRELHEGRNVNLERFAEAEIALCADLDTLRSGYAVPGRIDDWARYNEKVLPALTRVSGSVTP